MKILAIIQARMGSTRLPEKILKKVEGKEILAHVIERVLRSKMVDLIVVATTTSKKDDVIASFINNYVNNKIKLFRGSENDVLDRYYQAAKEYSADIIIRITSDCPLIDSDIIDKIVQEFIKQRDYNYISNTLINRTFPRGLDVEVFNFKTLETLKKVATTIEEKEHVTWYIKKHPEKFKTKNIINNKDLSHLRWTVDEENDLKFIRKIYSRLYHKKNDFKTKDILKLLEEEPELSNINSTVKQKKVEGREDSN